jgi:hypothetical protein
MWPAQGSTLQGGSGTAYIWLLEKASTVNGNNLSGTTQTCKLSLPDIMLTSTIAVLLGGSKVQIQIPPAVWAQPTMPTFPVTDVQTGWGPPNTSTTAGTVDLIGLSLPSGTDPALAWPSSSGTFPSGTTYPDNDGDGNPGITATPLSGNGYVLPPVDGLATAKADQVYIVSRNEIALSGAWTSCSDQSGTANVMLFDNHVVGCHVSGGSTCTTGSGSQAGFLDMNRTIYTPQSGAMFVAKTLASSAMCADAISALP